MQLKDSFRWRRAAQSAEASAAPQLDEEGASTNDGDSAEALDQSQEVAAPEEADPKKDAWNFEPGTEIAPGRSVVKSLGGGNRFEVYLSWDDRLFALMVTKIIRPAQVEDPHALDELAREFEVLSQLAHPCLVRSYGVELDGPYPHLLLEHIEGPTLRRLIKRERTLPLAQLLPLALHVTAVLHYLSAVNHVHLDVKPSNIVMGMPPRLIDLSIAQTFESAAGLRHAIGTDPYMPPEQCDPVTWSGQVGHAADVWGLGATLFHAIAGETPFPRGERKNPDRTLRFPQLVMEPKPLPKRTPAALQELIAKMLAKDPAERPTASEVAMALEPLIAFLPQRISFTRRGLRTG